jgi:hypothetical protein
MKKPEWDCRISKKEAKKIMRYHGTHGLKITHNAVFARINSKWVRVKERRRFK